MIKGKSLFDQLPDLDRRCVATLLCTDPDNAGFRNLLRDIPALEGKNLTLGDFARAVHRQMGKSIGLD